MSSPLKARAELRAQLARQLREAGRIDLASPLERCAERIGLTCTHCGTPQNREVETRCKRRWCPVCAPAIAARKSTRVRAAMTAIKWPLFLTLTMPNNDDPAALKILSKVFAKFRRGKWWRQRDVKGGVACFEITNKGNGWHPHLHALIDCKWLASTPPPSKHCSGRENKRRSREAQEELSRVWGSHIGYEGPAVVWAKRAAGQDIAQEIAKYAVKGSDLAALGKDACRVIDVLAEMRTMITWGSLRPLGPIFEAWEKDQEILYDGCECDRCHATGWVVPDNVYQMMVRAAFAR